MKMINLIFVWLVTIPTFVLSQDSEADDPNGADVDPVTAVVELVKFADAVVQNNLHYDGQIFGYSGGDRVFVRDYGAKETFTFYTGNYDSIQFYSEFSIDGRPFVVDGFFLKVTENKPFEYRPVPVLQTIGLEMEVDNKTLRGLAGKKLYEINVSDDVGSDRIAASPMPESDPYIIVEKIDTATFYVKLKGKEEFSRSLTPEDKAKWSRGEEVIFPVGIRMFDKNVAADVQEYRLFLKKKKSPKKKN